MSWRIYIEGNIYRLSVSNLLPDIAGYISLTRLGKNGRHVADDIFEWIVLKHVLLLEFHCFTNLFRTVELTNQNCFR